MGGINVMNIVDVVHVVLECGPEVLECEPTKLEGDRLKRYQSTAVLLNFAALDRPDIAYSAKELMRKMAEPTEEDETALRGLADTSKSSLGW